MSNADKPICPLDHSTYPLCPYAPPTPDGDERPYYCAVCGPETRFATPQQRGDHIWDNHARAERHP